MHGVTATGLAGVAEQYIFLCISIMSSKLENNDNDTKVWGMACIWVTL